MIKIIPIVIFLLVSYGAGYLLGHEIIPSNNEIAVQAFITLIVIGYMSWLSIKYLFKTYGLIVKLIGACVLSLVVAFGNIVLSKYGVAAGSTDWLNNSNSSEFINKEIGSDGNIIYTFKE